MSALFAQRSLLVVLPAALAAGLSVTSARGADKTPDVVGAWTGTWGAYAPPPAPDAPKKPARPPMKLECQVTTAADGKYEAVFEGDCGRPYKYRIQMPGRLVGKSVLFSGTVDLGKADGGVYDWIGRANDTEFVGFYTSEGHVGSFQMARPPKPAAAQ